MVSMMVIGQGELQLLPGVRARDARLVGMDASPKPERSDHLRHHRLVAVLADAHLDLVGEIDALDLLQEAVNEMLTGLLALGDDVDPGILLDLHREHGRVTLGASKLVALRLPGRPEHVGFGEPFRLRQGAGDRGWKQHGGPPGGL
jgi:hypothetical protein